MTACVTRSALGDWTYQIVSPFAYTARVYDGVVTWTTDLPPMSAVLTSLVLIGEARGLEGGLDPASRRRPGSGPRR